MEINVKKNDNKLMTFYNAILESDYCENGKDLIATYLMDNFFDENSILYLFNKNEENRPNVKIILIKYKLNIIKNNKIYNVPLLIYLNDSFPLTAPEIYIEKMLNLKINNKYKNFISENNFRINFEFEIKWNKKIKSTKIILNKIQEMFNKDFPVFKKNNFPKEKNLIVKNDLCYFDSKNCIKILKIWTKKFYDDLMNNHNFSKSSKLLNSFLCNELFFDYSNNISINNSVKKSNRSNSTDHLNISVNNNNEILNNSLLTFGKEEKNIEKLNKTEVKNNKIDNKFLKQQLIDNLKDILLNKIKNEKIKINKFNKQLNEIKNKIKKDLIIINDINNRKERINKYFNQLKFFYKKNDLDKNIINLYNKKINIIDKVNYLIKIKNIKFTNRFINIIIYKKLIILIKKFFEKKLISFQESIKYLKIFHKEIFILNYRLYRKPNE